MSTLYLIATPIGNLEDISFRAIETLKEADLIAAEDTRHSQRLLNHYHIKTPLIACHEHNEKEMTPKLIEKLKNGQKLALISDAGTPAISDPGYRLVKAAHAAKIKVVPLPGACAAICALSASGLPSDRFIFEGFLPSSASARKNRLSALKLEERTLIFYEAPHRLKAMMKDLCEIFDETREATLARELTKTFETIYTSTLKNLYHFIQKDIHQQKGECVIIVSGASEKILQEENLKKAQQWLDIFLEDMPLKKAVKIISDIFFINKNILYAKALQKK